MKIRLISLAGPVIRWLSLAGCALASLPAWGQYIVAPDIAREFTTLRSQVEKQPENAELLFEYVICLSYVGKVEESRAALKRVRALEPDFSRQALPRYLEQHRSRPLDAKITYRLGFLYYFNEDYERTFQTLRIVAEQKPAGQLGVWALGYMAVIKGKQKQWNDAERLLRQALALEPDAYALHAALAVALHKKGDTLSALSAYNTAHAKRNEFERYEKEHLR